MDIKIINDKQVCDILKKVIYICRQITKKAIIIKTVESIIFKITIIDVNKLNANKRIYCM